MTIISWLSDICLLLGAILALTGAVGLLRLPNFYTRLHAASVTESLAATLLITGIILDTGFALDSAKLVLVILILIIANPTVTHALCRAAAHGGNTPEVENQNSKDNLSETDTESDQKIQAQTKTDISHKGLK